MKKTALIAILIFCTVFSCFANGKAEEATAPAAQGSKQSEFTIMALQNSVQPDYSEITNFKKYEEISGVHINWITTPQAVVNEKVNLALASGDLPDAFLKCKISAQNLQTYGESGDFVDLKPLLAEHAPNFVKYANEHKDVWASITTPNGQIFSIPAAADSPSTRIALKIFYNQEWLDKLGLKEPTTADELYTVLKAFKEQDPNGNGIADEIPLYTELANLYQVFGGMFGCFNRGANHDNNWDADPVTGKVRYVKTSDAWRECLTFINKLYSEGLIAQESITYQVNTMVGYASQDRLGLYIMTNLARLPKDAEVRFVPCTTAITGPHGDNIWAPVRSYLHSVGSFVITTNCKDPASLLEWVDYFYSDEGCLLYHYGTVGETCVKNADGTYSFTPEILKGMENGKSYDESIGHTTAFGAGNNPTRMAYPFFAGMENTPKPIAAAEALLPYTPKTIWPIINYTPAELEVVTTVGSDINKYVTSASAKFITGEMSLDDASWASYVATVNKMGLSKYVSVQQAAVDRAEALMK